MNIFERVGLLFLLISSDITLTLFIINWLGIPINMGSLLIIIVIMCPLYFLFSRYLPKEIKQKIEPRKRIDFYLFGLIIILLGIVVINGLWNVVSTWDALTLYDFRALRIVETGSISQSAAIQGDYFYGYPLYTSLVHTSLYLLGLKSPMIFYSLLFTSFVSVFYGLLRRTMTRTLSLLATLLVILAPHLFWHAQIAYTNLPYTIYLGLGALYILEYVRTGRRSDAIFGALLTGLSIWVRSVEPFWMVNMAVLLISSIAKKQFFTTIASLLIFAPLERIWKIYVAIAHNTVAENTLSQVAGVVTTVSSSSMSMLTGLMPVLTYFVANAVRPYLPILMLLLISVIYKIVQRSRNWLGEFMIIGYYAASLYGTYVFSLSQPYWADIPGSLERMMMFISPVILYIFAHTISEVYHDK